MGKKKVEQSGDGKVGNTRPSRPIQSKYWTFTWNNYKPSDISYLEQKLKSLDYLNTYVFQEELGEKENTPHLQGSIELSIKKRWSEFNLPNVIHWERTNNVSAANAYCQKESTRIGGPYKYGFPEEIEIVEPYGWQLQVLDIIKEKPNNRTIHWFWEPNGKVGKSDLTKYLVVKHKAIFCTGGKYSDIMNLIFKSDMNKSKIVIFDLPRGHGGNISIDSLESIKNGLVSNSKYETGFKAFNPPHVIVLANSPPTRQEDLSPDRWNIVEIKA